MNNKKDRVRQIREWFYQNEPDMELLETYFYTLTWENIF